MQAITIYDNCGEHRCGSGEEFCRVTTSAGRYYWRRIDGHGSADNQKWRERERFDVFAKKVAATTKSIVLSQEMKHVAEKTLPPIINRYPINFCIL